MIEYTSDEVDLTMLSAAELVAYGDQVGWTTEEVEKALFYRMMIQDIDSSRASLERTMNDPTVLEAIRICDEHPPAVSTRGWLARLWGRIVS